MSDKVKVIEVFHGGRHIATIDANWASISIGKEVCDQQGLIPMAYRKMGVECDFIECMDANTLTKDQLVEKCVDSLYEMFPLFTGFKFGKVKTYTEKQYYSL